MDIKWDEEDVVKTFEIAILPPKPTPQVNNQGNIKSLLANMQAYKQNSQVKQTMPTQPTTKVPIYKGQIK